LTKRLVVIFSLGLNIGFLVMGGYVLVQKGWKGISSPHNRFRHTRPYDRLNLEPGQQARVDAMGEGFRAEMKKIYLGAMDEELAIIDHLMNTVEPDRALINGHTRKMVALETLKAEKRITHFLEVKDTLTVDQARAFFTILREYKQQKIDRRRGH
jgi:Spy/CpxP family protein refolding chaperone